MPFRPYRWRRRRAGLSLALTVVLLVAVGLSRWSWPMTPLNGVARVTDGDTIRIGAQRIRIVGIDAPERGQTCTHPGGEAWACGRVASAAMAALVSRGSVQCRPLGRDRYGRTLARCTVAGTDIGAAMVTEGLAMASGSYFGEEQAARAARRGIWDGAFTPPERFRRESADAALPGPLRWLKQWFH